MAEGIFNGLKKLFDRSPKGTKIETSLVAQEEANTILGISQQTLSDPEKSEKLYNIDKGALKKLKSRAHDRVLTEQAAKTVEAEKERDQAREMGIKDSAIPILFSRGYFETQLVEEFNKANRLNAPIGLAFGDIRMLKYVNDRYGHPVGDKLLRVVAEAMTEEHGLRDSDIPCRYGGDEDVVLFPVISPGSNTEITHYNSKDDLAVASIRMLNRIHSKEVNVEKSIHEPHMDIGVTMSSPTDTPDTFLRRADQAMYLAKKLITHGNDIIVIATKESNNTIFETAKLDDTGHVIYESILNADKLVASMPEGKYV